ncbi:MAG: hypothetical protein J2P55_01330 [Rhizobiales bacterium]|nr:hypothetical protein [Hyphomicrobiales bacterium]
MVLSYVVIDPDAPPPRPGRLTLTCDGCERTTQAFEHPDGYLGMQRLAMAAGWKETFRSGNRLLLGPCCSGKQSTTDQECRDDPAMI